jgi:hypothetical protein
MKIKVQVIIESEGNETPVTDEIASLTREDLTPETLGLTLAEAKDLLASASTAGPFGVQFTTISFLRPTYR